MANKLYDSLKRGFNHPATRYGRGIVLPTAVYGTLGYLVSEGLQTLGKSIDDNLPRAFQQTQKLDEIVGTALIEKGGKPAEVAIKVDKGVKDLWGKVLDIDEEQRQRNREILGLKEPSYLEKKEETEIQEIPVTVKTYSIQETQEPEFHYFENLANQASTPILGIALAYGFVRGLWRTIKRELRLKREKKNIERAVEEAIKSHYQKI